MLATIDIPIKSMSENTFKTIYFDPNISRNWLSIKAHNLYAFYDLQHLVNELQKDGKRLQDYTFYQVYMPLKNKSFYFVRINPLNPLTMY